MKWVSIVLDVIGIVVWAVVLIRLSMGIEMSLLLQFAPPGLIFFLIALDIAERRL